MPQPNDTPQRLIVITDNGMINLSGPWKVRELLGAAQALADMANNVEVETQPAPQPPTAPPAA